MSREGKPVYPQITEYRVEADLPESLVFLVISDIHGAAAGPLIDALESVSPDAVLMPGDYFHGPEMYLTGAEFIREAAKRRPVFCSLGNHEMKCDFDVAREVGRCGAVLLDNGSADFKGVKIGGLTTGCKKLEKQAHFRATPPPDKRWLNEFSRGDGFKILLSHHPEYYPKYIKGLPIDLVLSGHAHGGQWRFFDRGVFAPGQGFFPKYTSGAYEGRLIVSRGVGNAHLIPRINNKPEVLLIKITAKNRPLT